MIHTPSSSFGSKSLTGSLLRRLSSLSPSHRMLAFFPCTGRVGFVFCRHFDIPRVPASAFVFKFSVLSSFAVRKRAPFYYSPTQFQPTAPGGGFRCVCKLFLKLVCNVYIFNVLHNYTHSPFFSQTLPNKLFVVL